MRHRGLYDTGQYILWMKRQQGVGVMYTTYYFKCIVPSWLQDILGWLKFFLRHTSASSSLLATTLRILPSPLVEACSYKTTLPLGLWQDTTRDRLCLSRKRYSTRSCTFDTFPILLPILHKKGPWSKSWSAVMSNKNRTPGNDTIPSAEVAPKTVHGECWAWSTVIKGCLSRELLLKNALN